MARVRVEFYGLARRRAGIAEIEVEADTVGSALEAIARECPGSALLHEGRIAGEFLISLGGRRFVEDLKRAVPVGVCLLVLGADSGG